MVDGEEWHHCLNEADMYAMPRMMQNMFATILMNCEVLDPRDQWDRHCEDDKISAYYYQAPFGQCITLERMLCMRLI
jgi:hypothetical protein